MRKCGFTLAELLIALAILGVIATFTIPKVLNAQQDASYNAIAKEAVAALATAHQELILNGQLSAATQTRDFTHFLNYVKYETTSATVLDSTVSSPNSVSCSAGSFRCVKMHNGSVFFYQIRSFGGTSTTNALRFWFDPNGVYDGGDITSPGRSIIFLVYYNGKITSYKYGIPGTEDSNGVMSTPTNYDPDWFSW